MASNRIIEAIDFESNENNWKYSFKTMSGRYGKEFIEIIKAMWSANGGGQTEDEFCTMNGLPISFFNNHIKITDTI